ncbi:class A beta-lactamase [Taibaiella sp. KBW10]|uniref:class A beta-lactamase n=1 Tax=Taibaiella sp. KBW10 TaxID=2153357 RepID=UPI000F5AAE8D|nr:class A beta-lactamase [Taibaiella sp. KBW10]RQO31169.1 class A beta-lactamase [Taibaiella sp. KBW10]
MNPARIIIISLIALLCGCAPAQNNSSDIVHHDAKPNDVLRKKIEGIISNKKADIGISIINPGEHDSIQVNGDRFYPMLSTVKFPIALTILHKVAAGELSMTQKIFIKKAVLLKDTWSPFREKFPGGNISISLEEAMQWMICYSDNNMTDMLLRLIGGPDSVQHFINSKQLIVKNNEEEMHKDWASQFVNEVTPNEATRLLMMFDKGAILNKENTQWLYNTMVKNTTGVKRLKGKLPENVKVAHRTGTSFTNAAGMTGAINDIGIIELPDGKKIYIAVFIHDTYEKFDDGEAIIAAIAKEVYEYNIKK